ncbi:MAG: DUF4142 domain-containing protein [Acidobacteria bacterium]|nr:DUF4142 domain-containing protein [Acidobacteriota bacterium]
MKLARHTFLTASAIIAAITVGAAEQRGAQPAPAEPPRATQATAGLPQTSAEFVAKASDAGAAEVAQAKLAMTRASNPDVKAFASRMAQDHASLNSALMGVAAQQNLEAPAARAAESRATEKLGGLSGAAFDREYMSGQVAAHMDAIRLFEHEAEQGSDAAVKAWAQKTLPALRDHLKMAQDVAAKVSQPAK